MDVSLRIYAPFKKIIFSLIITLLFVSCGNRFDLSKERGRQARIDDANFHLSHGDCALAMAAIDPLYDSVHVNDEVRIIKASAYACYAGFNFLTLASNLAGATNYFNAMAKSMSNVAGDGARGYMYQAIDVLTGAGARMNANQRSTSVNTYMVFIQMATVSTLLRNYGSPAVDGAQGTDIGYISAPNNMSNLDGCAMASALAFMTDSYSNSSLVDGDSAAVAASFTAACGGNCSAVNKDRTICDGANAQSTAAQAIVDAIDASW